MKSTELRDWADRPVTLPHATLSARSTKTIAFSDSLPPLETLGKLPLSPRKRVMHNSPSPPLRGRCRRQRGVPCLMALSGRRGPPPLCHFVTSPPARGGRWDLG